MIILRTGMLSIHIICIIVSGGCCSIPKIEKAFLRLENSDPSQLMYLHACNLLSLPENLVCDVRHHNRLTERERKKRTFMNYEYFVRHFVHIVHNIVNTGSVESTLSNLFIQRQGVETTNFVLVRRVCIKWCNILLRVLYAYCLSLSFCNIVTLQIDSIHRIWYRLGLAQLGLVCSVYRIGFACLA